MQLNPHSWTNNCNLEHDMDDMESTNTHQHRDKGRSKKGQMFVPIFVLFSVGFAGFVQGPVGWMVEYVQLNQKH